MGCVNALLEASVNVPKEMKVIVFTNAEIEFSAPFPIDRLEISSFTLAGGLLTQLAKLWRNQAHGPLLLQSRLIKNEIVAASSNLSA